MRSLLRGSIRAVIKATHETCESDFKFFTYTIIFCDGINDYTTFSRRVTGRDRLYSGR